MTVTRLLRFRLNSRNTMAALLAASLALPATAPAQEAGASRETLQLPENPMIFGKNDPNHRSATVVVNGEVITGTDIDQRVALIVAASGGKIGPEEMERLRLQVLRNLMDETLQIQEAKAQDMEVPDAEVDASYERIARQNFGQDPKALDAYLVKIGSSSSSLKRQIRGELSWQRLLRRNVVPFVNVSDDEVRETVTRQEAARGSDEFRVGEIFLSANPENREAVLQNALRIVDQGLARRTGRTRRDRDRPAETGRVVQGLFDRFGRRRSRLDSRRRAPARTRSGHAILAGRPDGRTDRGARRIFNHGADRQAQGADRRRAR